MKKVAIVVRNINTKSGLGKIIEHQIEVFQDLKYRVELITQKSDGKLDRRVEVIKVIKFPFGKYLSRYIFAKSVEIVVKNREYDLVIGHGDIFKQDILFLHNLVEKIDFTIYNKNMEKLSPVAKLHREILTKGVFKKIVANSQLMKREIINSFNIPENRVDVIYPSYKIDKKDLENREHIRKESRDKLGVEPKSIVIGLITSGDFKKRGVDIFFKVIQLLDNLDNLRFLVVGKDRSISKYISGLDKNIRERLVVQEPIERVEDFLVAVDIMVYPAYFEEFGMVVQESLLFGTPVILSQNVGASELIKNRDLITLDNSPEKIKDKLEKILKEKKFLDIPKEDIQNSLEIYRDRVSKLIEELRES